MKTVNPGSELKMKIKKYVNREGKKKNCHKFRSNENQGMEFKFQYLHCQKFKFILVGKYLILICIYTHLLFTMEER